MKILLTLLLIPFICSAQFTLDTTKSASTSKSIISQDCLFDTYIVKPVKSLAYVRIDDSPDAELLYKIDPSSSLKLIGKKGNYYIINIKGYLRYVSHIYIDESYEQFASQSCPIGSKDVPKKESFLRGRQWMASLNTPIYLLAEPKYKSENVGIIRGEGKVKLEGRIGDFWKTSLNGVPGYVHESAIRFKDPIYQDDNDISKGIPVPKNLQSSDSYGFTQFKSITDATDGAELQKRISNQRIKDIVREYSSRNYYLGPRGGCYYLTSSGRKEYVDRSYCR